MAIDWKRLERYLAQEAKSLKVDGSRIKDVMEKLSKILCLCGVFSNSNKMVGRIGKILISNSRPVIVAPSCPDYENEDGLYTFRGLNGGISLLTKKHIFFLKRISEIMPANILILLADREADDEELCRTTGKNRKEFIDLLKSTLEKTREAISPLGWQAEMMTSIICNLAEEENKFIRMISADSEYKDRIVSETIARQTMYSKIRSSFSFEEMMKRTIKTAAQYLALGGFSGDNNYMVCNHTTTNLSWYLQTQAAVIHNPVSVY